MRAVTVRRLLLAAIVSSAMGAPLAPAQEAGEGSEAVAGKDDAAPAANAARDAVAELSPAVDTSAGSRASAAGANDARAAAAPVVIDRLDLGTTSITGNQELPKVLYIVPWKRSDLGDLIGRPVNTLLDEALAPVDRSVFERHLSYYETLHGDNQEE